MLQVMRVFPSNDNPHQSIRSGLERWVTHPNQPTLSRLWAIARKVRNGSDSEGLLPLENVRCFRLEQTLNLPPKCQWETLQVHNTLHMAPTGS
jgi:hypothetical protein